MNANKSLSRRQFLRLSGLAATGLAVAACAPTAPAPAPAQEGAAGGEAAPSVAQVELLFWSWASNRANWISHEAEKFTEQNPNITITVEQPENIMDKMQAAFVAGTGAPDLAGVGHNVSNWVKGDRIPILDITDRFNPDDIFASGLDPWTWQGRIYGIGNELNACLMFYRWDEFEKYGIEPPIGTWEDFLEKGIAYSQESGKKFTSVETSGYGLWYMLAQGGSGLFDEEGNILFDNEFSQRMLQMMQDWYRTDEIALENPGGGATYGALDAGEWIVVFGAPWYQGFMKANMETTSGLWELQMFPTFADGSGSQSALWGGTSMSITEQCQNVEEAWDFIAFCNLTTEATLDAFTMVNLFPTYKPAWENKELLYFEDEFFNNQQPGQWIEQAAPLIPTSYMSPFWFEAIDAFTREAIVPIMQENADVQEALANARQEVERIVERGG